MKVNFVKFDCIITKKFWYEKYTIKEWNNKPQTAKQILAKLISHWLHSNMQKALKINNKETNNRNEVCIKYLNRYLTKEIRWQISIWKDVNMCPPSWTPVPPPSPSHPSGLSQCTGPESPVSCIKPGLAIYFTYGNIHISMLFSQIIPLSPSPTESKSLFFTSVSLMLSLI